MSRIAELTAKLSAKDTGFSSTLRSAAHELKKLEQGSKGLSGALNVFGGALADVGAQLTERLTLPLAAVGGASIAAAMQFDDAADKIRVVTGATGEALAGLTKDFTAVFRGLPNSAADVSTAIADLNTRLGLSGEPLRQISTQVLNLARISGEELQPLIQATTRVMGDWDVRTEQTGDTLDYLYRTSQATGISVGILSAQLVQFGAPLRQMGFSLEQSAALLGKFEKEGVNAELVMGSLRIALTRMAAAGVTDASAALEMIFERIQAAGSAGQANALAMEYFGAKAGPDMAAAIREGRFAVADLEKSLRESTETINKSAKDTFSLTDRIAQLRNEASAAAEPIGLALVGALEKFAESGLKPALALAGRLAEAFAGLPPLAQNAALGLVAVAAAAGPVLFVLGKLAESAVALVALKGPILAALGAIRMGLLALAGVPGVAVAIGAAIAYAGAKINEQARPMNTTAGAVERLREKYDATALASHGLRTASGDLMGTVLSAAGKFDEAQRKAGATSTATAQGVAGLRDEAGKLTAEIESQATQVEGLRSRYVSLREALEGIEQGAESRQFVENWIRGLADARSAIERLLDPPNLADFGRQAMTVEQHVGSLAQGLQRAAEAAGEVQFGQQIRDAKEIGDALSRLGIQRRPDLEQMKEDLEVVLQRGTATERNDAQIRVLEARKRAGEALSKAEEAQLERLKQSTQGTGRSVEIVWNDIARRVNEVFGQMSRSIADLIWQGGNFGDRMKGIFTEFAKGLTQLGLERLFHMMGGGLAGLTRNLPGLGSLGAILGGGGRVAGAATSVGGAAASAPGAAGAMTAVTSGLMGTLGAIGSLGGMVSGIIGNFQTARTNRLLGETTRGIIGLVGNSTGLNEQMNRYLPALEGIHERLMEIRNLGVRVFTTDSPLAVVGAGISGGGGGITINMAGASFIGFRDLDAFLDDLARRLRQRGV